MVKEIVRTIAGMQQTHFCVCVVFETGYISIWEGVLRCVVDLIRTNFGLGKKTHTNWAYPIPLKVNDMTYTGNGGANDWSILSMKTGCLRRGELTEVTWHDLITDQKRLWARSSVFGQLDVASTYLSKAKPLCKRYEQQRTHYESLTILYFGQRIAPNSKMLLQCSPRTQTQTPAK